MWTWFNITKEENEYSHPNLVSFPFYLSLRRGFTYLIWFWWILWRWNDWIYANAMAWIEDIIFISLYPVTSHKNVYNCDLMMGFLLSQSIFSNRSRAFIMVVYVYMHVDFYISTHSSICVYMEISACRHINSNLKLRNPSNPTIDKIIHSYLCVYIHIYTDIDG